MQNYLSLRFASMPYFGSMVEGQYEEEIQNEVSIFFMLFNFAAKSFVLSKKKNIK